MADNKKLIDVLFEDTNLSELSSDFKTKATVIFETAVANQVLEEKRILKEDYTRKLDKEKVKISE